MTCKPAIFTALYLILIYFTPAVASSTQSPCGGPLVAVLTYQLVKSPSYPIPSNTSERCVWTIDTGDTTSTVVLFLVDLDIEPGDGCGSDSVMVYDGSATSGQLLETWCGQMSGESVQSSGPTLTVVYTNNNSKNGRGLSAYFSRRRGADGALPCNMNLEAKETYSYLSSPRYPQSYPNDQICIYNFYATANQLKVEFLKTDLPREVDGRCTSSYVTVYEGSSPTRRIELKSVNTRKPRSCGTDLPVYVGSRSRLVMVFITNTSSGHTGFRLRYKQGNFSDEYKEPCGGILTATDIAQTFTSPHYPNAYPRFLNCKWMIQANDSTKNVRLTGSDVNITDLLSSGNCGRDKLDIYDGADMKKKMATICGTRSVLAGQTFSDSMTVVFTTMYNRPAPGFSLQYVQTDEPLPCNFRYRAEFFRLYYTTTPGYPWHYRTNHRCTWIIERTRGSTIKVEFTNTNISDTVNCSTDYVNVYDGDSNTSPQIGRFCGTETPTFRSNGNSIYIEFVSGPEVNGNGLRFQFESETGGLCYRTQLQATRNENFITSTNYPFMYPRNSSCEWRLSSDYNSVIVLEVMMSDIEESQDCTNDWVEVHDGYNANSQMLGKWCGNRTATYRSTGDYFFIVLHSNDNDVTGRGLKLKYSTEDKPEPERVHVGAIVGGVFGGLAGIAVVSLVVFLIVVRPCGRNKSIYKS